MSAKRLKKLVAVDWDVRTLRIVHAMMGKRGVKIDKLLSVTIPSTVDLADPQQMGSHIRRTLDQEGIATRRAVVDVPRDQGILKTLTLPTAQPEELPGMVRIQISKELPFAVTEAVIDYALVPKGAEVPEGDVSVAAVRREVLEQYKAIFESAGLKLDRIGLRPFANKASVGELLKHGMPERVLFIDVRPTFMEIDVLHQGALVFSRSASVTIPPAGDTDPVFSTTDLDADEPVSSGPTINALRESAGGWGQTIASLVMEVTRSIEAYRETDHGATIDHVVIGGDLGLEETLTEAIQERLRITTELYNPASTFGWEPDQGAEASAFSASLGLVLGQTEDETLHFNFLHPKQNVSAVQQRLRKAPMVAAVVALFAAAVSLGFAQYTRPARTKLARVEAGIAELQAQHGDQKKFLSLVDMIDRFDTGQHVWVDVLYDVFSLLPSNQEMVINSIEMNQKEGRLTLKTRTKNRDTATGIIRALRAFRREGRNKPRFDGNMGPQTEKKGEKYPYFQDLRIVVLDDNPSPRKRLTRSSQR